MYFSHNIGCYYTSNHSQFIPDMSVKETCLTESISAFLFIYCMEFFTIISFHTHERFAGDVNINDTAYAYFLKQVT